MKNTLAYTGFALSCVAGLLALLDHSWAIASFAFAGGVFALASWPRKTDDD
jgi:hypothetical protein